MRAQALGLSRAKAARELDVARTAHRLWEMSGRERLAQKGAKNLTWFEVELAAPGSR